MNTVGDILRARREELGLTLGDVSQMTNIREHILENLERGEYHNLPSYVHAYGFLEQYAKVLGLDFNTEVKPFFEKECRKENFGMTPEEVLTTSQKYDTEKRSVPGSLLAAMLLLLLLVVGIVLYNTGFFGPSNTALAVPQPAPAPVAERVVPAPVASAITPAAVVIPTDPPGSNVPELESEVDPESSLVLGDILTETGEGAILVAPAGEGNRVATVRFSDTCWVYIESDTGASRDFIAEAGQTREVRFDRYFRMDIGNAAAVSVNYNNSTLNGFGNSGQPVRNNYFIVEDNGTMVRTRTSPSALGTNAGRSVTTPVSTPGIPAPTPAPVVSQPRTEPAPVYTPTVVDTPAPAVSEPTPRRSVAEPDVTPERRFIPPGYGPDWDSPANRERSATTPPPRSREYDNNYDDGFYLPASYRNEGYNTNPSYTPNNNYNSNRGYDTYNNGYDSNRRSGPAFEYGSGRSD